MKRTSVKLLHNFTSVFWRFFHTIIVSRDRKHHLRFLNYGYIDEELTKQPLQLEEEDTAERLCINMYHQTVDFVDLSSKDVLEVGSGRGGGAYYISRYMKPKSYIGVDINRKVVNACNKSYGYPGLSFVRGFAEDLPFENESFYAVVNVESSVCYSNMLNFLREVYRVLKPGGYLLFSDMRYKENYCDLKKTFLDSELKILVENDIVLNVVNALELDHKRRMDWINENTPSRAFKKAYKNFAGTVGSKRYQDFKEKEAGYWHYVLQKPA